MFLPFKAKCNCYCRVCFGIWAGIFCSRKDFVDIFVFVHADRDDSYGFARFCRSFQKFEVNICLEFCWAEYDYDFRFAYDSSEHFARCTF